MKQKRKRPKSMKVILNKKIAINDFPEIERLEAHKSDK